MENLKNNFREYEKLILEERKIVNKVVQRNMAEGIMFSAGTDTSIIAYEAIKNNPDLKALTVEFEHGNPKDTKYVKAMVKHLDLDHEFILFGHDEMVEAAKKVIKILKTFDHMEVRNSIPVFIGLTSAKNRRIKSVFTGDGLDELFGYPWQFELSENEFNEALSDMWKIIDFSSATVGKNIGIEVKQPYLDETFRDFTKKIPINLKVNFENGVKYGKWLMRKAYEGLIPDEVIWRAKAPCEQGTGTEILPKYFEKKVPTKLFQDKKEFYLKEDYVKLTTKEQLFYYEIFREKFGRPSEVYNDEQGKQCPNCRGYVSRRTKFCRICGNYPI